MPNSGPAAIDRPKVNASVTGSMPTSSSRATSPGNQRRHHVQHHRHRREPEHAAAHTQHHFLEVANMPSTGRGW